MTTALVWTGLAVAALGHGFLWTGFVNRLHGLSGPRPVIKLLTLAAFIAFLAIPAAIAWQTFRTSSTDSNPFVRGDAIAAYLWIAVAIGALALVVKPWIEANRYDRTVLKKWSADVRDIPKLLGRKPLSGAVAKFLGALPLNEALTLSVDRKRLAVP